LTVQPRLLTSAFFLRTARFALLAALVAVGLAAPGRVAAQQPAPAVQAVHSSPPADTARPQAAKSADSAPTEEETDNKFLQSPNVRKIAQLFHLSVGVTEAIFLGINFVVLALAIGIPLFRWLPKALRKHAQKVRDDIESARKVTADANARLSAIEAKLSGLDGEIAQFRAQIEQESKQDEVRIKSTIQQESARIVAAAEQDLDASAAQIRRGLRNFAADLAVEQATRQLALTPETDHALIAEFLTDVAKNGGYAGSGGHAGNGAKQGGQN
jgi:F-type H+-transporting ATPase subunit b